MESKQSLLRLFLFFIVVGATSSSFISNKAFELHGSLGRSLLQQKSACSVDFAETNYTVVTSQCKGPNYSRERCCTPLKQLMCPVKDQVNDLRTNCADVFFSHLNLYGKYPPGLFASLCKEDEKGLNCENVPPLESSGSTGGGATLLVALAAAAKWLYKFTYQRDSNSQS